MPRSVDPALMEELARQNPGAELPSGPWSAVVTGQQVGLFGGPAYSVYKAATAVALAARLGAVPIFWLQSEDHDADEVASCQVLDGDDALQRVRLQPAGAPRASMAHRGLGSGVEEALEALGEHLSGPHRGQALARLRRSYRPEASWVEAFASYLRELFDGTGLLVLDPRTEAVAELVAPVHRRALEEHGEVAEAVLAGATEDSQIAPRPGCSLGFFHPDGVAGDRFRLERDGAGWRLPSGARWSQGDVLAALAKEPRAMSTSALLRVVIQDTLLPVQAQVVGPGEGRYLAQLPPLHAHFGLPVPNPVPRARFAVVDGTSRELLDTLGVAADDVDGGLLRRLAAQDPGLDGQTAAARVREALAPVLDELAPELEAIEPDLRAAIERTRAHVDKGLRGFAGRIDRARARRDEGRVRRVEQLQRLLRPAGAPQERVLGPPHFEARFGDRWLAEVRRGAEAHVDAWLRGEALGLQELSP